MGLLETIRLKMAGKNVFDILPDIPVCRHFIRQRESITCWFRINTQWFQFITMILILSALAVYPDYHHGGFEKPVRLYRSQVPAYRSVELKTVVPVRDVKQDVAPATIPRKISKPDRKFDPIILEAASLHDLDPALIKAMIMAESGFRPKAVSKRGARGLMQLMPRTAASLGVRDAFNPEHNIHGGTRYFKDLLGRFNGDIRLGLAAYNAGSSNVRKYKGIPPYRATRIYIEKVLKYYRVYKKEFNVEKGIV